jgi:hypothetical protein
MHRLSKKSISFLTFHIDFEIHIIYTDYPRVVMIIKKNLEKYISILTSHIVLKSILFIE